MSAIRSTGNILHTSPLSGGGSLKDTPLIISRIIMDHDLVGVNKNIHDLPNSVLRLVNPTRTYLSPFCESSHLKDLISRVFTKAFFGSCREFGLKGASFIILVLRGGVCGPNSQAMNRGNRWRQFTLTPARSWLKLPRLTHIIRHMLDLDYHLLVV